MGLIILLPSSMAALICGLRFFPGHGPTNQGMTTTFNCVWMLSPLFVIYTLVGAFCLVRRRCPQWIKAVEATIAIILLVPLSITAFFAMALLVTGFAARLAGRTPGFP